VPVPNPRPLVRLRRKLATWHALPRPEKLWLPPVWLLLGVARVSALLLPFRFLIHLLGGHSPAGVGDVSAAPPHLIQARHLGRAIGIAARHTPWNANCLAQALVARLLLRLHGIPHVIHLGVRRTPEGALAAHAWVDAGPVRVTGGSDTGHFTVVQTFCHPAPLQHR